MKTIESLGVWQALAAADSLRDAIGEIALGSAFDEPYKLDWYPALTAENMAKAHEHLRKAQALLDEMKKVHE